MSSLLRKAKRTPIAIQQKHERDVLPDKKKHFMKMHRYRKSIKQAVTIDTVVSNWCDNGATKPKCGHCPNCLDGRKVTENEIERDAEGARVCKTEESAT